MGTGFTEPKTVTEDITSGKQQKLLNKELIPLISDMLGGIPSDLLAGFPEFTEEVPGLTDLQRNALANALNLSEGGGEITDSLLLGGRDTIMDILARADPGSQEFEEFFRTNIRDPLHREAFEGSDSIIQNIKRRGAGGDSLFGGGTGAREDELGRNLLETLARESSAAGRGFTADALAALGLSEPFTERANTTQAMDQILRLFGIGEGERQVGVQQRGGRLMEFMRQLQERNTRLGIAGQTALTPTKQAFAGPSLMGQISQAFADSGQFMEGIGSIAGASSSGGEGA